MEIISSYQNKLVTFNGNLIGVGGGPGPDPYNPLNLPPKTIRVEFTEGVTPSPNMYTVGGWDSCVQVSASPNIWDITRNSTSWDTLLKGQMELIGVLGANSEGVTSMRGMFGMFTAYSADDNKFTYVNLFDTSSVTDIGLMFDSCGHIKEIPFFDFSNVTDANSTFFTCHSIEYLPNFDLSKATTLYMFCYEANGLKALPNLKLSNALTSTYSTFNFCRNVESGILDMYNKLSGLGSITDHTRTFQACGRDTESGAAELAQIPSDWK